MRDKDFDDMLVLAVMAKAGVSLNKYQIEQSAKAFMEGGKQSLPQPVTHRGIREAIERLQEGGEIAPEATAPGRAPNTRTAFYKITDLGKAAFSREHKLSSAYLNVERAREIAGAEREKQWTPAANRAYCEMMIAYAWLVGRLGRLLPASFSEAKSSRQAEKRARTIANMLVTDLEECIRVCYRYRDVKAGDMPVLDYVTISTVDENTVDEQSEIWLENFAPATVREYAGWVLYPAVTYLFSRNDREGLRELKRELKRERGDESPQPSHVTPA